MAKRRAPRGGYRMTPARRAALRKAQLASARKRKRRQTIKRAAIVGGAVGITTAGIVARHRLSGSSISVKTHGPVGRVSGSVTGSHGAKVYRSGNVLVAHSRKRGPLGSYKSVKYTHQKLTGTQISGAAQKVTRYRPPASVKKMSKFNHAHGPQAKAAARIKVSHTTGRIPGRARDTSLPTGRSGRGSASRHFGTGRSRPLTPGVPKRQGTKAKGTTNPQAGRRISAYEASLRATSYMKTVKHPTNRKRAAALSYYSVQPLYTGKGTSGRRGRARSRELKQRKR